MAAHRDRCGRRWCRDYTASNAFIIAFLTEPRGSTTPCSMRRSFSTVNLGMVCATLRAKASGSMPRLIRRFRASIRNRSGSSGQVMGCDDDAPFSSETVPFVNSISSVKKIKIETLISASADFYNTAHAWIVNKKMTGAVEKRRPRRRMIISQQAGSWHPSSTSRTAASCGSTLRLARSS